MAVDRDAQHLALHPAVEALHHAVGLRRVGLGLAVLHLQLAAGLLEASAVKQEPLSVSTCVTRNGKARTASFRKATALVVSSSSLTARCTQREQRSMATYRKRLRRLAIGGLQLGQVLDVDVHEAEIVVLEGAALALALLRRRQAAEPLGLEDAVDRVAVQMRQEVA